MKRWKTAVLATSFAAMDDGWRPGGTLGRDNMPATTGRRFTMKIRTALAATTAILLAGVASAETMKIGITQNNVGVDSYQTTYEKAFIAECRLYKRTIIIVRRRQQQQLRR